MRRALTGCLFTTAMLTATAASATVFQDYIVIQSLSDAAPGAVVSNDFDNDGNADLAVSAAADDRLAIFMGNGDGDFDAAVLLTTGDHPHAVASAILSGANADLVSANRDADTLSVFINDGAGGFAAKVDHATGAGPVFVLAADLDGANNHDLVSVNQDGNSISVFLNNGVGGFGARTDYSSNLSAPAAAVASDMDGDGDRDLAVINQGDNSVAIFFNDGSGAFSFSTSHATGAIPHAIAAGDLNGDTYPDLVISNRDGDTVSVLLNNGAGGVGTKQDYASGATPHSVVLGDLDNDGDLDFAVTNNGSDTVSIFENGSVASASFNTRRDVSSVQGPSGLALAGLDGDAYPELVTTNLINGNVAYLQNLRPVTPDTFTFADVSNATAGTMVTSETVTITGLASAAPISINANLVNGEHDAGYRINGGAFTAAPGTINNGDTVQVRLRASAAQDQTVTRTLTIGGLSVAFNVTTAGDNVPDPFSIAPRTNAEPGEVVVSSPVTITGLGRPAPIIISAGEYRIDGGPFMPFNITGSINNNQTLEIRLSAAGSLGVTRQSLVSINGVQSTFIVTTRPAPISEGGGSLSPWAALALLAGLGMRRRRNP